MRITQTNVLDALQATQHFLDTHQTELAAVDLSRARGALDRAVAELAEHALAQAGGNRTTRDETARQRQLRRRIRHRHMRPIAAIAKRNLPQVPQYASLTMPSIHLVGNRFITAAQDMAAAAEVHAAAFIDAGLATDFVERFRAGTEELAQSLARRSEGRGKRVNATIGLRVTVKTARMLFQVLDSLVRPAIERNEPLVGEWDTARTISKVGQSRSRTTGAPPSGAPAVPGTPAAA